MAAYDFFNKCRDEFLRLCAITGMDKEYRVFITAISPDDSDTAKVEVFPSDRMIRVQFPNDNDSSPDLDALSLARHEWLHALYWDTIEQAASHRSGHHAHVLGCEHAAIQRLLAVFDANDFL